MVVASWFDSLCFCSQVVDTQEFDMTDNVRPRDVRWNPVIDRLLPFVVNGKQSETGQLHRGTESQQFLKEFHHLFLIVRCCIELRVLMARRITSWCYCRNIGVCS